MHICEILFDRRVELLVDGLRCTVAMMCIIYLDALRQQVGVVGEKEIYLPFNPFLPFGVVGIKQKLCGTPKERKFAVFDQIQNIGVDKVIPVRRSRQYQRNRCNDNLRLQEADGIHGFMAAELAHRPDHGRQDIAIPQRVSVHAPYEGNYAQRIIEDRSRRESDDSAWWRVSIRFHMKSHADPPNGQTSRIPHRSGRMPGCEP